MMKVLQPVTYKSSRLRRIALLCIAFCLAFGCKHHTNDPFSEKWEKLNTEPIEGALILKRTTDSNCSWAVTRSGVSVSVLPAPASRKINDQREIRLPVDAGTLVGTNNGEWGGHLVLVDKSGVPGKDLLSANILQLLPVRSGVLVITGLLHLGEDSGSLWIYSKSNQHEVSLRKLSDLSDYPRAFYPTGDRILMASGRGVSIVDDDLNQRDLAHLPFSKILPNSITQDAQGRIYIGADIFVVRLVPSKSGYEHEWFTQPDCLK